MSANALMGLAVSSLGAGMLVTVLVIILRNKKHLRSMNIKFCVSTCVGGLLCQLAVVLGCSFVMAGKSASLTLRDRGICRAIFLLGCSISFSSLAVKNYILHRIFNSKTLRISQLPLRLQIAFVVVFSAVNTVVGTSSLFYSESKNGVVLKAAFALTNILILACTMKLAVSLSSLKPIFNESLGLLLMTPLWLTFGLAFPSLFSTESPGFFAAAAGISSISIVVVLGKPLHYLLFLHGPESGWIAGNISVATSYSEVEGTADAVAKCLQDLAVKIGMKTPSFLYVLTAADTHEVEEIRSCLARLMPGVPVLGSTSCRMVVTESSQKRVATLGMTCVCDPEGVYQTVLCDTDLPKDIEKCVKQAKRLVKDPTLVLAAPTPGTEEDFIGLYRKHLGDARLLGGSSADNNMRGHWRIFTQDGSAKQGVALLIMSPSVETSTGFFNIHSASSHHGVVTEASTREIKKIDGEDAAEVYNRWTGDRYRDEMYGPVQTYYGPGVMGGDILAKSSLFPLGIKSPGKFAFESSAYRVAHPSRITQKKTIEVFADIKTGSTVHLMVATETDLIQGVARVGQKAIEDSVFSESNVQGAFVMLCAGVMQTIQKGNCDNISEVSKNLNSAFAGAPFMINFPYGEQGTLPNGDCSHANLMNAVAVFSNVKRRNNQRSRLDTQLSSGDVKIGPMLATGPSFSRRRVPTRPRNSPRSLLRKTSPVAVTHF